MAAVTSEAAVCNLALGIIGQRQLINSLDEATTEAQMCKAYFASVRNKLLQRYAWRFATKRQALALTTETRSGWAYCYVAPADMLLEAPCRVWDGQREPGAGARVPFSIELNDAGDGHLILTDMESAEFIYTRELRTVALWPAAFVAAVAAQLAVALSGALPVKPELMPSLQAQANAALLEAMALSANAAQRDVPADSELIRERG